MISCICPTYNRVATQPYLLEEAVESFLRQTHKDSELIIVNDHPGQKIELRGDERVRVINHPVRFKTLGEKYNFGTEQARGDIILPWEDDDISLPGRIRLSICRLGDADYYNPKAYFVSMGGAVWFESPARGYAHNCSAFTKAAWAKVGGYPKTSGPQDAQMDGILRASVKTVEGPLSRAEAWYLYRWGVSSMHLSANKDPQQAYDDYAKQATVTGTFILNPHWREDYEQLVKEAA